MTEESVEIAPIVSEPTRTQSESVETIINNFNRGDIIIPDYQRDAEQWGDRKESLFIESLLNNLTTPALFFLDDLDTSISEVIDGQQRLNTILKYERDKLRLNADDDINYLSPQSIHYSGKKFSELPQKFKTVFRRYPLTIIYLPPRLDLRTKLEIFRRINEGGTPLTAQDIRLSYYSESKCVYFVRLAGIHADSSSAKRMIEAARQKGVDNPWKQYPEIWELWKDWWEGKDRAKGQTPSAMVLWYLVFMHREKLDVLLSSPNLMKHLPLAFHGSTEGALDIYCAQLQYTDTQGGTPVFPTYGNGLEDDFRSFAQWIGAILGRGLPGVSVDKYKQMALLIGAAVELGIDADKLSFDAWDAIAGFIQTPRRAGERWLKRKGGYPESRGRWKGDRGQKAQCDMAKLLLAKIVDTYP
ncbi:DUF262 domain-containing protein [Candidatus Poribacteria bacterium]|nr:DUF262 domain-containing protein [Candidatus Poribacteria bacterium]MYA56177.1 DUF262 domain-containing protein [Candidatus Poribacteria bacterium]